MAMHATQKKRVGRVLLFFFGDHATACSGTCVVAPLCMICG